MADAHAAVSICRSPHPVPDTLAFPTATGKARLTVNAASPQEVPAGNTTIYALNDRYRGIRSGRRVVMVNPDDLADRGLASGSVVERVGEGGRRADRFWCVAYDTPRGCLAAYFPETNALVSLERVALESGTPTITVSVCRSVRLSHLIQYRTEDLH